jgi:hypothetical protein
MAAFRHRKGAANGEASEIFLARADDQFDGHV